jgi:dihydrofolate synthase/folylpolyglutamate synthase
MTRDEAVAWIDAHAWRGVRPGLARIAELLELFGDPHRAYPVVHVAGTNGKTSVARFVSGLIAAHGLVPGTFTSPHLHRVEERFPIALEVPDEAAFIAAVEEVRPLVDLYEERSGEGPTYFELTALLAFNRFANEAVDVGVIEVGLGGRLDATNVVDPAVAVVTSIGLDHTEILGDGLAQIAAEKLGIVKPGTTLVTGDLPPEALEVAEAVSAGLEVPHLRFGDAFAVADATIAVGGWLVDIDGLHGRYGDLFLPLHGRHQADNLATAIAATESFFGRALSADDVAEAVSSVTMPGRLEVIARDPVVVVDGAHNPDGMVVATLAAAEEFAARRWVVVLGAMADKDLDGLVEALEGFADEVITTAVANPRAATPERLAEVVATHGLAATSESEPERALSMARERAGPDGAVLVVGSLYLVGRVTERGHLSPPVT